MTVAYALLYTGLRTTPSGTAVVATLVEPVIAVLIAILLLNEHLSRWRLPSWASKRSMACLTDSVDPGSTGSSRRALRFCALSGRAATAVVKCSSTC